MEILGNKTIPVKPVVDEALEKCKSIESVIVLERTKQNQYDIR